MNIAEALADAPGALCVSVIDPMSVGFGVVGLPHAWRRTRTDTVDGYPAATWIDTSVFDGHPGSGDANPMFASVALVMAWRLRGLSQSLIEIVGLFSAMTKETPGWSCRRVENGRLDGDLASDRLFGSLESPYGSLICNAHTIVRGGAGDEAAVVQLTVNANPDTAADEIALCRMR